MMASCRRRGRSTCRSAWLPSRVGSPCALSLTPEGGHAKAGQFVPRFTKSEPPYFTVGQSHQRRCPVTKLIQTALEQIHSHATACLRALCEQVASGTPRPESWDAAREALEALP